MALAVVKMRSRVKRRLKQGSTGQEVFSDRVVKGSNGRFNDNSAQRVSGGSKILTDKHGCNYSICGSDHPLSGCAFIGIPSRPVAGVPYLES